jgi:hypothetical protein
MGKVPAIALSRAYHVDRPRLRFQAVGATRMMCREPVLA